MLLVLKHEILAGFQINKDKLKDVFRQTILVFAGILISVLIALTVLKNFSDRQEHAPVLSGVLESREIRVGSKMGGRIAQLLVNEGATMNQGEIIATFDPYDLPAKQKQVVALIGEEEANLQKLEHGPRPQEINQARSELADATAVYQNAKDTYERYRSLYQSGFVSSQDYENKKTAFKQASAQRELMKNKLKLLEIGTRIEEIDAAKSGVKAAQANLQQIATQLDELVVRAPAKSVVEVVDVRPGDIIPPNTPIATLLEPEQLYIKVYLPETRLGLARLGKQVEIQVDSFPDKKFHGVIDQIASQGEFTPRNIQTREERTHQVFAVKIKPDNSEGLLHAGMTADVKI